MATEWIEIQGVAQGKKRERGIQKISRNTIIYILFKVEVYYSFPPLSL